MHSSGAEADGTQHGNARLRVLSFSTVFPRPRKPRFGMFVEARLRALSRLADVAVVSPEPLIDFSEPSKGPRLGKSPESASWSGALQVHFPRWAYLPSMGWTHPWWLAKCSEGPIARLRNEFPFQVIDSHFGHPEANAAFRLAHRFGVPFTVTLRGNETFHAQDARKRRRMAEAGSARHRRFVPVAGLRHRAWSGARARGRDSKRNRCAGVPSAPEGRVQAAAGHGLV